MSINEKNTVKSCWKKHPQFFPGGLHEYNIYAQWILERYINIGSQFSFLKCNLGAFIYASNITATDNYSCIMPQTVTGGSYLWVHQLWQMFPVGLPLITIIYMYIRKELSYWWYNSCMMVNPVALQL